MEKSKQGTGFTNWPLGAPLSCSAVLAALVNESTRGTLEQFMNPLFQRIGLQKCDYIRATTPRDYHTLAKADNILPWMK